MADGEMFFRREAIEAARVRTGYPLRKSAVASWIIIVFMVALFGSVCTFLVVAKYTQKETVLGEVVPADGVVRVASLHSGLVKKVWVSGNQAVAKDQRLLSLSFDTTLENGATLSSGLNKITDDQIRYNEAQGQAKKQEIFQSQIELQSKLNTSQQTLNELKDRRQMQAARIALMQKDYDALQPLVDQQYISTVAVHAREDSLISGKQTLLQMDQEINQAESEIPQLRAQLTANRNSILAMEADRKASRSQLDERRLNNMSAQAGEVVALTAGNITSIQVKEGDSVAPNQTLALIVPRHAGRLQQVTLWAPSKAIGFVQPGDKVRLMFDAFPFQTFGVGTGHVAEISTAPLMPNELPIPIDTKEQMYKIVLNLDRDTLQAYGRNWLLRPGMRLSADLIIDDKSLLDWLIDPIVALRKRNPN